MVGRLDVWKVAVWLDVCLDCWTFEWMVGCVYGWLDLWLIVCMYGWMDGSWMYDWMFGYMV